MEAPMPRPFRSVSGRLAAVFAWVLALGVAGCDSTGSSSAPVIVPLSAVVVSPDADSVRAGEQVIFTASAYDTLGVLVNGVAFTWTSEDRDVFTVSGGGRVNGVAEGAARLLVESNGVSDTALVYVYADTGWVLQPNPSNGANLNGVHFRPDGRLGWAVGDAGRVLYTSDGGASWFAGTSATSFNLYAVWFTSDNEGWAVGNASTVLRTTNGGATWTRVTSANPGENLHDVIFTSPTTGFAVGTNGTVIRTTNGGTSWIETNLPTSFALYGVAFGTPQHGWAVGAGGVIADTHDGGASWNIVPAVTSQTLNGVWATGDSSAYAAGDQGVTARTTAPGAGTWELAPNLGAFNGVEAVHFPSPPIGFAVGFNAGGIALRTGDTGETWTPQAPRTSVRLNDVWFVDPMRGWAVGDGGVIVHTATGGTGF
jgi:photosystem II stability/assembly factor-like uncharacterized protein